MGVRGDHGHRRIKKARSLWEKRERSTVEAIRRHEKYSIHRAKTQ
nr:MAG TPA: hypothetical protein [Caudoviricetes sp.]